MKPFDFVNEINTGKKDLIRGSENPELAEKLYASFVINRALSFFPDTIMYSNEMNKNHHIDKILQNDYYLNSIRFGKRFSKWHKRQENEDVDAIQEYYGVNNFRALEISKILSKEHIDLIKIRIIKGGNNVQSKSVGGSTS
jgi:hypothetical protein